MQSSTEDAKSHKARRVTLHAPVSDSPRSSGSDVNVMYEGHRSQPGSVSYQVMMGESDRLCPWCKFLECACKPFKKIYVADNICNWKYCVTYIQLFWLVTTIVFLACVWVFLYAYENTAALPGGYAFGLFMLCITSYFMGWWLASIGFPTSIGMFAIGILFINVGWIAHDSVSEGVIMDIRAAALGFTLIRGGLLLGPSVSKKDSIFIVKMAVLPGLSEFGIAALVSALLTGIKWDWALLLGSTVAPMSPLAILHSMTRLKDQGYGEDSNIFNTLLYIHTFDNIVLITVFCMAYTTVSKIHVSAVGPLIAEVIVTIIVAVTAGFLLGMIITYFPHRYDPYCGLWRTLLLFSFGFAAIIVSRMLKYDGAGYLCATIMALTASMGWKSIGVPDSTQLVKQTVSVVWHVVQPIILAVMGTELDFKALTWKHTLNASIIFLSCLIVRVVVTYLASMKSQYNKKERLFMAIVCMCKGSSQAALGPTAWMAAKYPEEIGYAQIILRVCIFAIILTITIAPFSTLCLGKKLLRRAAYDVHLSRPVKLPSAFLAAINEYSSATPTADAAPRGRSRSVCTKMVEQQDVQYVLNKYYQQPGSSESQ